MRSECTARQVPGRSTLPSRALVPPVVLVPDELETRTAVRPRQIRNVIAARDENKKSRALNFIGVGRDPCGWIRSSDRRRYRQRERFARSPLTGTGRYWIRSRMFLCSSHRLNRHPSQSRAPKSRRRTNRCWRCHPNFRSCNSQTCLGDEVVPPRCTRERRTDEEKNTHDLLAPVDGVHWKQLLAGSCCFPRIRSATSTRSSRRPIGA